MVAMQNFRLNVIFKLSILGKKRVEKIKKYSMKGFITFYTLF